MKIFKILLKVLLVLVIIVVIAIIAIPTLFRGKIESAAKNIISEKVNAKVDFQNLTISILRDFPNLNVSLDNFTVIGKEKFEGDTLASLSSLNANVSLWALIKGDIVINSIVMDEPDIYAKVLENGQSNWDIAKTDSVQTVEQKKDEDTTSNFSLKLKKLQINKGNIVYDDASSKTIAGIKNLNVKLSGDLSSARTTLNVNASTEGLTLYSGNSSILNNWAMNIDSKVDADLINGVYTLQDNEIIINRMALSADGTIKTEEKNLVFDLTYGLKVPSLKSLLEMIPTSIVKEVKDIETRGTLAMNGYVKGKYNENSLPVITLNLSVKDGYAKYAGMSEAINNINIEADMLLDKNKDANSVISLSNFTMAVAGNPFAVSGKVLYPFTNPDMDFTANGTLDFNKLQKSMPLTDATLSGILKADISFAAQMSQIEKEQYDKIKLAGNLEMNSFKMRMEGLEPEIALDKASLTFNPASCTLNAFDGKMGSSDLHVTGKLENVLNYLFKGGAMKGNLALKSSQINCSELMSVSGDAETTEEQKPAQQATVTQAGVIVLPSNVDFNIAANIDKLIYENLTMTNTAGQMSLKNGKLDLSNLSMNALEGKMTLTGSYFAANEQKADVKMNFNLSQVDIADVAKTFDIFGKLAPIMKDMKGKTTVSLDFTSAMDENMNFNYKTLNATGKLKTDSLSFISSDNIQKLASLLKTDKIKGVKDVNLDFSIVNGMVNVKPFDVKVGGIAMKIGGQHGINNDLAYNADVDVPAGKLADLGSSIASKLGVSGAASKTVKVGVEIGGNMSSPTFKLGLPKYGSNTTSAAGGVVENVTTTVKEKTQTIIDSAKNTAKEKVQTAVDSAKNKLKNEATDKLKDLFNKKKK